MCVFYLQCVISYQHISEMLELFILMYKWHTAVHMHVYFLCFANVGIYNILPTLVLVLVLNILKCFLTEKFQINDICLRCYFC